MASVVMSTKGQIVIPKEIREQLRLDAGTRLAVSLEDGDRIVLRREAAGRVSDWRRWRGVLRGTRALEEHLEEHRKEIEDDERLLGRLRDAGVDSR